MKSLVIACLCILASAASPAAQAKVVSDTGWQSLSTVKLQEFTGSHGGYGTIVPDDAEGFADYVVSGGAGVSLNGRRVIMFSRDGNAYFLMAPRYSSILGERADFSQAERVLLGRFERLHDGLDHVTVTVDDETEVRFRSKRIRRYGLVWDSFGAVLLYPKICRRDGSKRSLEIRRAGEKFSINESSVGDCLE